MVVPYAVVVPHLNLVGRRLRVRVTDPESVAAVGLVASGGRVTATGAIVSLPARLPETSVNQMLPSPPTAIPFVADESPVPNSEITPAGVIWPSVPEPPLSVKYRFPSVPATMFLGPASLVRPDENSVIAPLAVTRAMWPGFASRRTRRCRRGRPRCQSAVRTAPRTR